MTAHFELPAGLHVRERRGAGDPAVADADPGREGDGQQEPASSCSSTRPIVDNNVPAGEVTLTLRVNVLNDAGVQQQLSSTATVTVTK